MKWFRRFSKNNLDEMQEQKLLHIEKQSFWLLYWLIAVDLVAKLFFGKTIKDVWSEMLCFIIVGVFMVWKCLKNGIWDRTIKAEPRMNLLLSGAAGLIVAVINCPVYFKNAGGRWTLGILAAALVSALFTFFLSFTILSLCTAAYKKKVHQMEDGPEEDDGGSE